MILLPAIDLLDGACVRLLQGDYATAGKVAEDALATAASFVACGAEYLHIVDLNGAKSGSQVNGPLICEIIRTVNIPVEIGGGIRNMETVEFYLSHGADRVILGSAALKNPAFFKEAAQRYPGRIVAGIDARGGKVSIEGWTETSDTELFAFAKLMENCGAANIVYTNIERDGMLSGIDAEEYRQLAASVSIPITASGGVRDLDDICALRQAGVWGVICGKSIYSGTLDLRAAIAAARQSE